jgi:hypothetical protein
MEGDGDFEVSLEDVISERHHNFKLKVMEKLKVSHFNLSATGIG